MIDEPEGVCLYLIRMGEDPVTGLAPEGNTRTEYELAVYDYCIRKLAALIGEGKTKVVTVELLEMENTVRLGALIESSRVEHFVDFLIDVDTYEYSPYGPGAQSFGFYSQETLAWLFPHRDGPVLFLKRNGKEFTEPLKRFMKYMATLQITIAWPNKPEQKILTVENRPQLRGRRKRKRLQLYNDEYKKLANY